MGKPFKNKTWVFSHRIREDVNFWRSIKKFFVLRKLLDSLFKPSNKPSWTTNKWPLMGMEHP